jgi:hypothetical protein
MREKMKVMEEGDNKPLHPGLLEERSRRIFEDIQKTVQSVFGNKPSRSGNRFQ